MTFVTPLLLAISLYGAGARGPEVSPLPAKAPLSTGKEVDILKHLQPERPTVFVFYKPSSSLERAFLAELRQDAGDNIGFNRIELKTGEEPVARQYDIKETPTALVYDRRARLVTRSSDPKEVRAAVRKAAGVMRIDWADEGDPRLEESTRLLGRPPGTGILRTMTSQPEYLKYIADLSQKAHFSDGYLKRRTKEMIATYVSTLNHCKY